MNIEEYVSINNLSFNLRKNTNNNYNFSTINTQKSWTLKEACDYCVNTRWKYVRNKKSMQTKINTMISFFGSDRPISSITTFDIDKYTIILSEKYKSGTVNLYLNGLSAVLRTAYEREMIEKMPKIPHIKNRAKRIRFLSDSEEKIILNFYKDDEEMYDAIVVLIDTGIRKGELFNLKKDDINMKNNIITLWETKNGIARSIPMTERVRNIMTKRINNEKIFNILESSFTRRWEKMRYICGFGLDKNFVPHILRHTCCSRLIQRGAEIVKVSRWMGHSNIATTMIYAHLAPNSLSDIKMLLEK